MLGSNVPTVGGLPVGFRYADEWHCECIQVYLTPSRTWDVPRLSQQAVDAFRTAWARSSVQAVVAHVPFLVNVASPNTDIWRRSVKRLSFEVSLAKRLGVPYVVLHPGSSVGTDKSIGTQRIITALRSAIPELADSNTMLLLETMAGQGSTIGAHFEDLVTILEAVGSKQLGICFDTAHIFAAGYNFTGSDGYREVLETFDAIIGLDQIKVMHLNDSKVVRGSCMDRHAAVGEGTMGLEVFHSLLRDARFSNVPMILEIPERDEKSERCLRLLERFRQSSRLSAELASRARELVGSLT